MLTTIELNFYSHLVVDSSHNEIGQIHYLPDADWDTQPWKAYIEGVEVFSCQSFMGCFRHLQQQYKTGVHSITEVAMLTTIELNFYSYLVLDAKGNEIGQIHHAPTSDNDEHPWKACQDGIEGFNGNSFMRCFRHLQQQYKTGVHSIA